MVTSIPFLIARISDDNDFLKLKELASVHDCWHSEYDKNGIKIWSRFVADVSVKMFKVWTFFSGINSSDLYNTLMDPIYRTQWDAHVILTYDIGYLNPNNTICYYAASCPPPLKSRDFVLQSSWLDLRTEHYVINHSVCHKDHPPRPGFVRAVSYFTGYYIKAVLDDGCEMTFVSQTDPQGIIPAWIVNKCTQILAPRFVRQVEKAALGYRNWKTQNNPNYYPWVHPDQMKAPKISVADCVPSPEEKQSPFFKCLMEKCLKLETRTQNQESEDTNPVLQSSQMSDTSRTEKNEFRGQHVTQSGSEIGKKGKQKQSKTFWLKCSQVCFRKKSEA